MFQVLPQVTRLLGQAAPGTHSCQEVGRVASQTKEPKESNSKSVMGPSLRKSAGLGMPCESSCRGRKPIKALGSRNQADKWDSGSDRGPGLGLSRCRGWLGNWQRLWMLTGYPRLSESRGTALTWFVGAEQAHPQTKPAIAMLQSLPLMKIKWQ